MNSPDHNRKKSSIVIAFAISAAIHTSLVLVLLYEKRESPYQPPEQLTEIEIAEPPSTSQAMAQPNPPAPKPKVKEQKIAESEKADNDKLDPNATILSDKNQTVEKQTRAQLIDDFRKKAGTGTLTPEDGQTAPTTEGDKSLAKNEILDAIAPAPEEKSKKGVKRNWKSLSLKDLSVQGDGGDLAATDDKLDDVDRGERTVLSTREFRYFSYYHRIKELLRQYWKPNVEQKLYRMWEKGKVVNEAEMVTRLVVTLKQDGTIEKISRTTSSGIYEVDQAAVEAFERAGPFPNPPKGIAEADGFIRINWEFILKTEAAPRIQFSTATGNRNPADYR